MVCSSHAAFSFTFEGQSCAAGGAHKRGSWQGSVAGTAAATGAADGAPESTIAQKMQATAAAERSGQWC